MERGLYGQAESNESEVIATQERYADVESEGTVYEGVRTEKQYREDIAKLAAEEIKASEGESRVSKKLPALIHDIVARGWQADQLTALEGQAAVIEDMQLKGYSQGVALAALNAARPIAYASRSERRQANNAKFQGAPDRLEGSIKGVRRLPKMYTLERDSLVDANGTPRMNGFGEHIKI